MMSAMSGSHIAQCFSGQVTEYFKRDYHSGRADFLAAYERLACKKSHEVYPLDASVAGLETNVAFLGNPDASKVLVLISGTHGVEGYCGSAIQSFFMDSLAETALPQDLGVLLVHALNPWGMYWARRCDEAGVDLNRNFIDFAHPEPLPAEYDDVLDALMQSHNPYQEMLNQAQKWGQSNFDRIFSSGQYVYAWAPFYGGKHPAHGRRVIEQLISKYQLGARHCRVIDLHTGLGPWSFGELISDHPAASKGNREAGKLFGAAIANAHEGASFSVPKSGLLDYCFHRIMQQRGFFLTLEFGTYGTAELFEVLFTEHRFWKCNPPSSLDDADYLSHRARMVEHFCPNDLLWQQAVLFKSWQVLSRVIASFASSNPV